MMWDVSKTSILKRINRIGLEYLQITTCPIAMIIN